MPKRVFWPVSMIIMGLIFLASNLGYLPKSFWNLWPLILIVVGLGGLLTSDTDQWMVGSRSLKSSNSANANSKRSKKSRTRKK